MCNFNGTYRKTQKSKLIQKFSFQPVYLQESYIALIDMGKIIRHNLTSGHIIFRHNNATRIICVNDPYDTPEEMADIIVLLHCLTGCDANSARVNSLGIEEEAIEELFEFTRLVVCGDKVSRTMGTAQAAKWKAMKKKSLCIYQ